MRGPLRILAGAALALVVTLPLSCTRPPERPAAMAGAAVRVVSLSPNLTEIVCAIGAADCLVGRSSACDFPPEILQRVPVVGDFGVPSLETLARLKPDLLLSVDLEDKTTAQMVGQLGIRYENVACRTLDDIPAAMRTVGRLLHREAGAERAAADLARGLAEWRSRPRPVHVPGVFFEIWSDPLMTVGRRSFISEMLRLAGGSNVCEDIDRDYAEVSPEAMVARDPEVVILMDMTGTNATPARLSERAGWSQVKAVRTGRVYGGLDPSVIEKPGPRVLQGVRLLHACLHPSESR